MQDEFMELLDTAIYKEIASEALYSALKDSAPDPSAISLLGELSEEEQKHVSCLMDFKEDGSTQKWSKGMVADLRLSDHLIGPDRPEGAGLQDTLIFAMKKEQQAIDFYSRMTGVLRSQTAKRLCQRLVNEEMTHKVRLETMYARIFLGED